MTCITALNYSLKDGMLTVIFFLLVIARILFPPVTGHFGANLKMRKYFEELCIVWRVSPCYRRGPLLMEGEDDAHVFGHNSF